MLWRAMCKFVSDRRPGAVLNCSAAIYKLVQEWTGKTWAACSYDEYPVIVAKMNEIEGLTKGE